MERIAREVLTNPVIEEYRYSLEDYVSLHWAGSHRLKGVRTHVRHCRLCREEKRLSRSSSRVCAGWNIAATIPRESPLPATAKGLQIRRAEGKLRNLEEVIRAKPLDGTYGIGHTRWATHGRPSEENAHPHRDCTGRIVVVHNGIVENYLSPQEEADRGRPQVHHRNRYRNHRPPDREDFLKTGNGHRPALEEAVRKAVKELTGVFALSVIAVDEPNKIVSARNGPPAVIGLGKDEYFVASDVPAILYHTRDLFFLGDGDLAVITPTA